MFDDSIHKFLDEGDLVSLVGLSPLVPFDLFWVKRDGKKVLLKKSGDLCSRSELERWTKRDLQLEHSSALNQKWFEEGVNHLNKFFELHHNFIINQKELQDWRKDFINWLSSSCWEDQEKVSRLDICFLFGTAFYDLNEKEEEFFLSFPVEIQNRNYLVASFGILLAMVIGYTGRKFLEDYFKVLLFLDLPFASTIWSESEKNYLIQEWSVPGLGETLSSDIKKRVLSLYNFDHSEEASSLRESLEHKGLYKYLRWSFERVNGSGPLLQLHKEDLGDLDILTIFINHCFSYDEELNRGPEQAIIREIFNRNNEFKNRNLKKRLETIVQTSFSKAQELQDGYLQIMGL